MLKKFAMKQWRQCGFNCFKITVMIFTAKSFTYYSRR